MTSRSLRAVAAVGSATLALAVLGNCSSPRTTGPADPAATSSTVSSGTGDPAAAALAEQAGDEYGAYVRGEADLLLERTREFAELYTAGEDDRARALYPQARTHWERMEPVAESFGDLDPRMDAREADLEPGTAWTGWHAIEKDLWPPTGHTALTAARRTELADRLVADTEELNSRTRDLVFTPDQIGSGSKELLDEVASGKVTGEEEIWSHTDLWDFQANVDGAEQGHQALRPLLEQRDPELDQEIAQRFVELQALLDEHRSGEGFVGYDELDQDQVKALSDAVNALAEPLSRMTAAVA